MKITLISPIFSDLGISTLAPLLKNDGHDVRLLFIPQLLQEGVSAARNRMIANVADFVGDADLIGVNSFSENHLRMAKLVDGIKEKAAAPLVWGGIDATLEPEGCLSHADIVCVGEGEKALTELARRLGADEDPSGVKNLLFRGRSGISRQAEFYPLADLNELPGLDYDLDSQYIAENGRIRNVTEPDFNGIFIAYSGRGCPFRCSYCCSGVMHELYRNQKVCRQRSLDRVLEDIRLVKSRFPSCRHIWFNEADFLVGKTEKDIGRFARVYRADIGVPFSIWSNPAAVTAPCLKMLKDAGLVGINIGTVNASERIQRLIYKRNASAGLYMEKAAVLKTHGIKVEYDFILCNPYEDEDDIISTIRLLMALPKPFKTVIYTLTYFPRTELYEMALKDGKIGRGRPVQGYTKATYKVWKFNNKNAYINIVASLMRGQARRIDSIGMDFYGILPAPVLEFLISKRMLKASKLLPFSGYIYQAIGNLIMALYIAFQKISSPRKR